MVSVTGVALPLQYDSLVLPHHGPGLEAQHVQLDGLSQPARVIMMPEDCALNGKCMCWFYSRLHSANAGNARAGKLLSNMAVVLY